jgi:hypothetical protein
MGCFWQKNRGSVEIILHFFLCFFFFLGFCALQAVAFQGQARKKPFPKKSCLKDYRRFFVFWEV